MTLIHSNPMRQKDSPMSHSKVEIQKSRKGLLHKKLGIPQGQKIPADKLDAALHSKSPAERKEANFARNFGH